MSNEYVKRKVALKDIQPCLICNKPSTTVLFNGDNNNGGGADWFYVCDIHLQDNIQFVVPVYSKEYENEVIHLRQLKQKITSTAAIKNGNWDGWVTKLFAKGTKSSTKTDNIEADSAIDADNEDKGTKGQDTKAPADLSALQREYDETLDRITKLQKNNKTYQLSDTFYQSRLERKKQQEKLAARRKQLQESYTNTDPDELLSKFAFPSVPKTS
ncbi:hypothetical protein TBLA_0D02250 [Henningerozyma blattae CBS 6284]|uniref:VPS4-associated protein 1 n=1 Tax=Henningerozyma blattae (strain ATCC 34711 / CBS 6284 / DSM 70876 / NBRC 10599 / NRRL Y-10934 / UCD 77-7) TaxID=1071380 RepID=I2H2X7_HENB6|nr:hypothetical protein TBLA_0D02250 [Tetrapisispora blattae CBS 6284]CCH60729.1 hypothetical protein TBLA_0D02250 [Tetrapisispora blattae CBS 6284]